MHKRNINLGLWQGDDLKADWRLSTRRESTLDELGLPSGLARATVDWQQRIGDLGLEPGADDFTARADAILTRI